MEEGSSGCSEAAQAFSLREADSILPTTGAKAIKKPKRKISPVSLRQHRANPPQRQRPSKTVKRWWLAVGLYAMLLCFLSLVPIAPQTPPIEHLDKLVHVCEYLVFAWLLMQAIRLSRVGEVAFRLWAWLFASSFGLLMEGLQLMVPWRSAEMADLLANAIGAALGVSIGQRVFVRSSGS